MSSNSEYEYSYDKNADFYCYPGTNVLINKFGIRDKEALRDNSAKMAHIAMGTRLLGGLRH
jgi:hypothetical protein